MDLITKLEKHFGAWAIPNLTIYLIAIQAIGVVLLLTNRADGTDLILYGSGVLHMGQWWRLLSFLMMPSTLDPLWLFFAFYVFYLIGSSLERHWGTFRFNLFMLCGYLLTVMMAFINPGVIITNAYFLGCAFLAFATLFPNVEFRLFFVLPVKVKWLGIIAAAGYLLALFRPADGNGSARIIGDRLSIIAAFVNYALFFGKSVVLNIRAGKRRKAFAAENRKAEVQVMHECTTCGVTDQSDPSMHFRYCSTCGKCFCEDHIGNHEH